MPLILSLKSDTRSGVQKLLLSHEKRLLQYETLRERHRRMLEFDDAYAPFVIGIDEVGRGPLFGPVLACACNIRASEELLEVYDSKSLSEKKREKLFDKILKNANCYGIGISSAQTIDEIGIQRAISLAMKEALDRCFSVQIAPSKQNLLSADTKDRLILADYITFEIENYSYVPVKKGDMKSFQIACASIIAKVTRDRMIEEMASLYPGYDLASNKGYGSRKHLEGIARNGASKEHRKSFLKGILNEVGS